MIIGVCQTSASTCFPFAVWLAALESSWNQHQKSSDFTPASAEPSSATERKKSRGVGLEGAQAGNLSAGAKAALGNGPVAKDSDACPQPKKKSCRRGGGGGQLAAEL